MDTTHARTVIDKVMSDKGLSDEFVASEVGCSFGTLYRTRRTVADRRRTLQSIRDGIAAVLEVEVSDLFDQDGRPRLVETEE